MPWLPAHPRHKADGRLERTACPDVAKRRTLGRHGGGARGRLAPSGGTVLHFYLSVRRMLYHMHESLSLKSCSSSASRHTLIIERMVVARLRYEYFRWRHASTKHAGRPVSLKRDPCVLSGALLCRCDGSLEGMTTCRCGVSSSTWWWSSLQLGRASIDRHCRLRTSSQPATHYVRSLVLYWTRFRRILNAGN